jgi:hypothetical protein
MIAPTVVVGGTGFGVTVGSLLCRVQALPCFVENPRAHAEGVMKGARTVPISS